MPKKKGEGWGEVGGGDVSMIMKNTWREENEVTGVSNSVLLPFS